jgi:hypothetical protein
MLLLLLCRHRNLWVMFFVACHQYYTLIRTLQILIIWAFPSLRHSMSSTVGRGGSADHHKLSLADINA